MTSKEKAIKIVDEYLDNISFSDSSFKQSAISAKICVQEIISESKFLEQQHGQYYSARVDYWQEVLNHLNEM